MPPRNRSIVKERRVCTGVISFFSAHFVDYAKRVLNVEYYILGQSSFWDKALVPRCFFFLPKTRPLFGNENLPILEKNRPQEKDRTPCATLTRSLTAVINCRNISSSIVTVEVLIAVVEVQSSSSSSGISSTKFPSTSTRRAHPIPGEQIHQALH